MKILVMNKFYLIFTDIIIIKNLKQIIVNRIYHSLILLEVKFNPKKEKNLHKLFIFIIFIDYYFFKK